MKTSYNNLTNWQSEYEDCQDIYDPGESTIDRFAWVFLCPDSKTARFVKTNYERAMLKRSNYICRNLADHLIFNALTFRAVMFCPDWEDGSALVGQLVNDIFVASHFAPATNRGGVEMLKNAASRQTPFVFAVPENLAKQLVRLGFKDTGIDVPQWFNGEYVTKRVVVNNATTQDDLNKLAEHFSQN